MEDSSSFKKGVIDDQKSCFPSYNLSLRTGWTLFNARMNGFRGRQENGGRNSGLTPEFGHDPSREI